ncbi:MAG TPA: DsrE/DsrF/DrsH-like family protein [Labilithrix sp.]|nr:DsrE/DsrF/DrsH-like family protein [Labilithrix sp.]
MSAARAAVAMTPATQVQMGPSLEERFASLESRVERLAAQIPSDRVTIVVFSNDFDKLFASFVIATGAAAMGSSVSLFFTFWGLTAIKKKTKLRGKRITDKMLSAVLPAGAGGTSRMNMFGLGPTVFRSLMRKKKISSLEDLIALAREMGVRMIGCQMSMDVMGIQSDELLDGVEVGGVATYLQDACDSRATLFI